MAFICYLKIGKRNYRYLFYGPYRTPPPAYATYIYSLLGTFPDVSITHTTSTDTSITVNISTIPSGIERVIIGYHRLDLGVPVVGEYGNNGMSSSRTFSSLVPGAKYRITAWGLGGGKDTDRKRSQSPAVREVTTMVKSELMQWSIN